MLVPGATTGVPPVDERLTPAPPRRAFWFSVSIALKDAELYEVLTEGRIGMQTLAMRKSLMQSHIALEDAELCQVLREGRIGM